MHFDQYFLIFSIPSVPGNRHSILWLYKFDLFIIGFLLKQGCLNFFCSSSIISRILCMFHFSFSYSFSVPISTLRYVENQTFILFSTILPKYLTGFRKWFCKYLYFTIWHFYDSGLEKFAYVITECFQLLTLTVSYSQAY